MDAFKWEELLIYSIITLFGTIASYLYRVTNGLEFTILSLVSNLFISSFGGILTFLICAYFKIDPLLIGAACGISGWSGSKIIEELESRLINKVKHGKLK